MATAYSAQTGITVDRSGNKFTATWKIPSGVKGQELRWRMIYRDAPGGEQKITNFGTEYPATTDKKATFTLSGISIPTYLAAIQIQLRAKYTESTGTSTKTVWTEWDQASGSFSFNTPPQPTLTYTLDDSVYGQATWTMSVDGDYGDTDHYMLSRIQYQTINVTNASGNPTETQWASAVSQTKQLSDTASTTATVLANASVTTFVRVRTQGAYGYSNWKVQQAVFATPNAPQITSYNVTYNADSHYLGLYAEWTVTANAQRPVETTMLQYRIGKPTANMGMTNDGSWTDVGATGRPTSSSSSSSMFGGLVSTGVNNGKSSLSADLTETVDDDECVWIRAVARYSGGTDQPSTAILAYIGVLAAPSNLAITNRNDATHVVTISCTNNSQVPDSKLAIIYQPNTADECVVAVFPHGTSSMSGIQCPNWDSAGELGFRAYAFVGSESYTTKDGVKYYTISPRMTSDAAFTSGGIPKAPANVSVIKTPDESVGIRVTFDWTWKEANKAEISWSTRQNAWNSTAQPDTYIVDATNGGMIDIGELTAGQTYYVRVRLMYDDGDTISYGPYSATKTIYLSERPAKPVASVSVDVVTANTPELTVSWTYVSMDGTDQIEAKIAELNNGVYTVIAFADTEQRVTIDTSSWADGTQHHLCVNVTSASNETSVWSDPVTVLKAEPPTCTITETSLESTEDGYELTELPLTVTATGAGNAGSTLITIVRAETFIQIRPDDSSFTGYAGEIAVRRQYVGEGQQTFTLKDLIRMLDDTAKYKLVAVVTDKYGQQATDSIPFTVSWSHQAVMPEGTVEIEDGIAKITVIEPVGAEEGDTVDIYRLSKDRTVMLYRGAEFGDVIVDPYPPIGPHGGYRLVMRTANGDYTTEDMEFAWLDIPTNYNPETQFMDFDGQELLIKYNVDLGETAEKDFTKTKYLGGRTEGDWLEGVSRSGSVDGVLITEKDVENIDVLDALMDYSGPARIRTKNGNSYLANVNATTSVSYTSGAKLLQVSLTIDRVDDKGNDGMTLVEWSA